MKFAIPFSKNFKYPNQNIEWNINYKPKIKQLNDFIEKYGTHRINLIISNFNINKDFQIILALKEKFNNTEIVLCFPKYNKIIEKITNKKNLSHYYNEIVTDWDKLQEFLRLNVTDIFVGGDLMFNIKSLSAYAKKYNKSLRCYTNYCQSTWQNIPSLKTFFIRPEDIYLYEPYIDIFEFYIEDNFSVKSNILYEAYAKDKKWFGKLKEIIVNYKNEDDNRFIISWFGESRLNCNKRCVKDINSNCQICEEIIKLNQTLKKHNLIVDRRT